MFFPSGSFRYLKSTIGNIMLINRFRKRPEDCEATPEEKIFNFWIEYFVEATKTELGDMIRFPVSLKLWMEPPLCVCMCVFRVREIFFYV